MLGGRQCSNQRGCAFPIIVIPTIDFLKIPLAPPANARIGIGEGKRGGGGIDTHGTPTVSGLPHSRPSGILR